LDDEYSGFLTIYFGNVFKNLQPDHTFMTQPRIIILLLVLCFQLPVHDVFAQYLHRSGKKIVDANNNEVILRGMGLGGWMLQEGYMLETNGFANTQTQIKTKISQLIGETATEEFYDAWLANHCTERDIDSLASWGFNSVRLPMHYNLFTLPIEQEPIAGTNTWLEKGFAMTDDLLRWCEKNQIYLILDLHAAPGGQGKDAAISDYDPSKPSLWESDLNKQKTIALWRKLAERYKDEEWIGGYDLINETNWAFQGSNINGCDETTNVPLRQLLVDITTAIREVDTNHIIYIEGNCWANNHNGLLPFWDNNMVLSFHKYWNYNDQGSVQGFVNLRDQHNVPLWLGESGENSNVWFRNAIKRMEDNSIGWAWWPMKKVGSVVNPLTVIKNEGYAQLLDYWKNGGAAPSAETAKAALMQLAENLKIEHNIMRPDVIDAMFRQVQSDDTKPFKQHVLPGTINASDFDLGRYNKAYVDTDTGTYHVSVGEYTPWNRGWTYRNDGVDIQENSDTDELSNGYSVAWTSDGEWLQYTVDVDSSAVYDLDIRYAMPSIASSIQILVDGSIKTPVTDLTTTGGYANYGTKRIPDVTLTKGKHIIRLVIRKGGANLSYLKFSLNKKLSEIQLKAVGAQITDHNNILLSVTKSVASTSFTTTDFTLSVNGSNVGISGITLSTIKEVMKLTMSTSISDADQVTVSYNGDAVTAEDGALLEDFSNLVVQNNIPYHNPVPGKVEAENFYVNEGLQLEKSSDAGGGSNIGYTDAGDYLEYRIRNDETSEFTLEARVASQSASGKILFEQLNISREVLNSTTLNVPSTGGWQIWTTISTTMKLDAGASILRVKIVQPQFNLNWMNFTRNVITGLNESAKSQFSIYPNPADSTINIVVSKELVAKKNLLVIRNMQGKAVKKIENLNLQSPGRIDVENLPHGTYVVELKVNDKRWTQKLVVNRPK
jgi:endoglucanase